jgi:Zn finger protein HypA/HybF involved in hydrogenase expression
MIYGITNFISIRFNGAYMNTANVASWRPPENYGQVPSAIDGITVYAPIKQQEREKEPVTYHCPKCGATTRYKVSAGGVACEHCGFAAAVDAKTVGRMANEFEFTLETIKKAEQGWGTSKLELHCDACGADMVVPERVLAVTCPFCTSNRVNIRSAPTDQLQPLFLVPFQVQPDSNAARVKEWLGRGWFHPKELTLDSTISHFNGIYLPFFTFDASIDAQWKAEVGYERQERYYDAASKEWRTRTVIDWRWETGAVGVEIDDMLCHGSTHISQVILERIYPYDLRALKEYRPDFLAGWQAHGADVPLMDAWDRAKATMREMSRKACHEDIHSLHVRNFSMKADFKNETWRYILLPVYLASYCYAEKVYQVMINGQTGAICGQKPVAWWKVWLAIAAALAPGMLGVIIGLPLIIAAGLGLIPLFLGIILLFPGVIFALHTYTKAVASEAG